MNPRLGELLYWAACWIAAVATMLALAAWLTGGGATWAGVITFFIVSVAIWIIGRLALFCVRPRRRRKPVAGR